MKVKYDSIGIGYNLTRKPDTYLTQRMLIHLKPQADALYLDIGCGTGNYTCEFQKRGYSFIGIDPSETMLKKARTQNKQVIWKKGTAEHTGLPHESVDGITAGLTIHHWENLKKAFSELYRILKPKSRMVIFTSTPQQMKGYWLQHYFPNMMERSIKQMPTLNNVQIAMKNAGFEKISTEKYAVRPDLEDQFLYCGKENPELYFDEHIRNGISSFSDLSNKQEVATGLTELRRDINQKKIDEVMKSYQNKRGDYLYIIAEKPGLNFN